MILSNISKAIREQDWFAAAVEFVIVIAGVVIGFQVNAWNESRQADSRANELLVRITEEFRTLEATLVRSEEIATAYEAATENVIRAIREDTIATTDPETMTHWLGLVRHVGRPPTRSAVFAEMVASGELSLLPTELRTALSRFNQTIERNEYLWPEAASHLTGSTALFDAVDYTSLNDSRRALSFDPELVPLAESDLEALVIYQGALRYAISDSLENARETLVLAEQTSDAD